MKSIYYIYIAALASSSNVLANSNFKRSPLALTKLQHAPVIDGIVNEREWQGAKIVEQFVEFRPTIGKNAPYPIKARIGYDAEFFYVAAEITQPQDTITDRVLIQGERMWDEDYFGISLDTNYDKRDGYLFHVTPSGIREEGLIDGTKYIGEWTTIWYAKTSRTEKGWSVEMAIPVQSISFDPSKSDWGLQLRHKLSKPYKQIYWNLNDPENYPWTVPQVAKITNITGLNQGKGIELKTGLSFKDNLNESKWTPSMDAFYKFTPNITGVLTLNTDFSGTDVDEVNINMTRFSEFFSEKRDFFLQDSQVFSFGGFSNDDFNGMPFYSRRIGQGPMDGLLDVNWGTKVTGKIEGTSFGVLSVNQERDGNKDDSSQLTVARVKQQINENHQVGVIATDGNSSDADNTGLYGVDYRFSGSFLDDQQIRAHAWYQETDKQPGMDDTKAYGAQLYLPNDAVYVEAKYRYLGEDFNPSLGFVNRKGINYYELMTRFRERPTSGLLGEYLNLYQLTYFYYQHNDTNNNWISKEYAIRPFYWQTKSNATGYIQYDSRNERLKNRYAMGRNIKFSAQDYKFDQWKLFYETPRDRIISGNIKLTSGKFFDSDRKQILGEVIYKPSKHLMLTVARRNHYYERDGIKDNMYSTRIKANIAFNEDWSWNTMMQHNTRSDSLSIFSRLRYQSAPDELYQISINKGYDLNEGWHQRQTTFDEKTIKINYINRW